MATYTRQRKQSHFALIAGFEEPTTPSTTKLRGKRPILLAYDEIPEWYQDNDYILHGYRPVSNSARACFSSWLYMHNETLNIWSHLLPAVLFLTAEGLLYQYFRVNYPKAAIGDRLILAFFLLTAATCLGISATYHTLINHSIHISVLCLKIDFVGIVVLTLGDFVSGIYMGFYCEPVLQKIYWAMIVTLGSATIIVIVNPKFQGRRWRTFRACTFVCTGLSGFIPLAHGIQLFGISQMKKQSGMLHYLIEGLLLIIGVFFYTTRIPESLRPGMFDKYGSSHQIFHVLVVLATTVHLIGILAAFDYNYHYRTCTVV